MEIWRELTIPPFKTFKVSSTGRVHTAPSIKHRAGFITLGNANGYGYRVITLYASHAKKTKQFQVHRLIATAFIENPNSLPYINHIDGNKENNAVENLEWCTALTNMRHAIKIGLVDNIGDKNGIRKNPLALKRGAEHWTNKNKELVARGSRHGNSILCEKDVLEIRSLRDGGMGLKTIAKQFKITREHVWLICARKAWTHI